MKRQNVLNMVSKLLEMADNVFCNNSCNDLPSDFFEGMEEDEIKELHKHYHDWNGDPEEYDPDEINGLTDSGLMAFFSDYIKEI